MSQAPEIPSLKLDQATAAVEDAKSSSAKSFGKIKQSFKKILSTPRSTSGSELEDMAKNGSKKASAAVTDAFKAVENSATTEANKAASRFEAEANAAKAEVTGAIKKASDDENVKKVIGVVVAAVAIIAAVIAGTKKEKPAPVVEKKKGWF